MIADGATADLACAADARRAGDVWVPFDRIVAIVEARLRRKDAAILGVRSDRGLAPIHRAAGAVGKTAIARRNDAQVRRITPRSRIRECARGAYRAVTAKFRVIEPDAVRDALVVRTRFLPGAAVAVRIRVNPQRKRARCDDGQEKARNRYPGKTSALLEHLARITLAPRTVNFLHGLDHRDLAPVRNERAKHSSRWSRSGCSRGPAPPHSRRARPHRGRALSPCSGALPRAYC